MKNIQLFNSQYMRVEQEPEETDSAENQSEEIEIERGI